MNDKLALKFCEDSLQFSFALLSKSLEEITTEEENPLEVECPLFNDDLLYIDNNNVVVNVNEDANPVMKLTTPIFIPNAII